jgi:serine/threonine protein kinase
MIIANKYKIIKSIGEGSFGKIYSAENIRTREMVALKSEPLKSELKMLKYEAKVYQYLGNKIGFPQVKWFGIEGDKYFMALTLMDYSLKYFKDSITFSLSDIFLIGKKMIERIEFIHFKGIIHRDIKPDNFLIKDEELYLIDFGLCKKWQNKIGKHIEEKIGKTPLGTPNFISINVHNGIEPSRRDDLESIGYILLFLILKEDLPWSKCISLQNIIEKKIRILDNKLPVFLKNYLNYCRNLSFSENPDYLYLKEILQ